MFGHAVQLLLASRVSKDLKFGVVERWEEELNSMAKHFIQGEVLMMSRTGFLEWMVGAPKGSLCMKGSGESESIQLLR
jgi:hypothetical protein